jgi:amino acid transporter
MADFSSPDGKRRVLSVFTLVMINVIAVDSLRSIPFGASFGFSLVFYYLVAALVFFIPSALVAAELASTWPKTGGIYVWVREAFGPLWGVIVAWIQWIYNICWFPTILSLLGATLAYLIDPTLINNKVYMLSIIFVIYWLTTLINALGMRASGLLSAVTAIIGTIVPMLSITFMGIYWLYDGRPLQFSISWAEFFPDSSDLLILVLLTNVLFGLLGMEMSAVHAQEVKNPQRDYPRALLLSTVLILFTLIGSSLAVAMVVPKADLNLVSGLLDAFRLFLDAYSLSYLMPLVAVFIIIGGIGGLGAWIIGPSKAILAAAQDGYMFTSLKKTNVHGAPIKILLVQGLLFTLICSVFLLSPSVQSAFWILSNLTSQLALFGYVLMFSAAIRLRYKYPDVQRAYKIPGGNYWGMWVVAGFGFLSSLITMLIGLLPPTGIEVGENYYCLLIVGYVLLLGLPMAFFAWARRK